MNFAFDYKFGNFIIPRSFILYSSKYFFAMAPPNQFLKGRKFIIINFKCNNLQIFYFAQKETQKNFQVYQMKKFLIIH